MLAASTGAGADEADAKRLLKGMSDYLSAQNSLSVTFDSDLEVVTRDEQRLALLASGAMTLNRPDKVHATRTGGFADVEILFDGKTLTILAKNANVYAQADAAGPIANLIGELRDKYQTPVPASDLLLSNAYDVLVEDVVDIKDLGSGVIGGMECDHLAFRTEEVDWQIWIAQGDRPYPCRYTITSKQVTGGPQYSVQFRDWKAGDEVAAADFSFNNPTNAKKVEMNDIAEARMG